MTIKQKLAEEHCIKCNKLLVSFYFDKDGLCSRHYQLAHMEEVERFDRALKRFIRKTDRKFVGQYMIHIATYLC